MSWASEKAKLLLAHKLEVKQIWLSRTLAGVAATVALVLTAYLANVVGVRYAASLRREELQHHAHIQILQHREDLFYQRQLFVIATVDSLYKAIFDSYIQTMHHYAEDSTSPQVMKYGDSMGVARNMLLDALHVNIAFLDDSLTAEMERHAILYGVVRRLPVGKWPLYSKFFYWLQLNISWRTTESIRSSLDSTNYRPALPIFRVSDYLPPALVGEQKGIYESKYLESNFNGRISFVDSLKLQL
jgi:hypothetical protein